MPVVPNPFPGSGQNPLVAPPPGVGVVPTPIGAGSASPLDLTTVQYASQVLAAGGVVLSAAQVGLLPSLITSVSREIIRYCGNRVFPLTSFTEILVPEGGRQDRGEPASAKTSQFPIQSVDSVMTGRATVLAITNRDASTNQIAQVSFSTDGDPEFLDLRYTGLTLVRWSNGTKATDTLSFAGYPTVEGLATAINALGHGWSASVQGRIGNVDPGKFPSASLVGVREPKNALANSGACLDLFLTPASSYDLDRSTGILRCYGWGGGGSWGGGLDPAWDGLGGYGGYGGGQLGWGQFQVTYSAGWATVPLDLQQVAAEAVKGTIDRLTLDGRMKSQSGGSNDENWSWTARDAVEGLSPQAKSVLNFYRSYSV